LNEGLVRPDQTIDCEHGVYRVGGKVIHDHHPYDRLTVAEILKFSSNIGAAKIGQALDRERYFRYLTDFGFGRSTGIDLPGEVTGLLRQPSQWFDVDLAAISFGQGMTVTPLQLAIGIAAIANGGYLMAPYVVQRAVNAYGETTEIGEPRVVRQVVSERVAHKVRDIMITATQEGGTGTLADVPGYRVAGKTGTAQKVDPVTGGYSADKRVASFVGFVPADAPRLVILVVIDEPGDKVYGGLVAAPVFSRIALQSLQYLKVPPTLPVNQDRLPPLPPSVVADTVNPVSQSDAPGEEEEGAAVRMPDCIGMSYRQVLEVMQKTGINMKLTGKGRAVQQSPLAGRPIRYGNEVWVRLSPPT
jgi:cell division protein FtsI (penicillin-binding protein 3)